MSAERLNAEPGDDFEAPVMALDEIPADCLHNWNYGDDARWCLGCGTFELGGFVDE